MNKSEIIQSNDTYFIGKENIITMQHLQNNEICEVVGYGNSMTPILKSGQHVIVEPINKNTILNKNDIIFCKVNGNFYLHKIIAIKNNTSYMIGNNHGHINGTISRNNIYGKVIKILTNINSNKKERK